VGTLRQTICLRWSFQAQPEIEATLSTAPKEGRLCLELGSAWVTWAGVLKIDRADQRSARSQCVWHHSPGARARTRGEVGCPHAAAGVTSLGRDLRRSAHSRPRVGVHGHTHWATPARAHPGPRAGTSRWWGGHRPALTGRAVQPGGIRLLGWYSPSSPPWRRMVPRKPLPRYSRFFKERSPNG
jgi:hypothetical protein